MLATNKRDLAVHLREGERTSDVTAAVGRGLNCGYVVMRCMPLSGVGFFRSLARAAFVVVIHWMRVLFRSSTIGRLVSKKDSLKQLVSTTRNTLT